MKTKNTIRKISKYAMGASALLVGTTADAAIITNDIADLCYEPTTQGETLLMDINGDGNPDISLFAYDPAFDDVYIMLTGMGGAIGTEPDQITTVYPSLDDVDFDCATSNVNSSGSIDRLGVGVTGVAPFIFDIGGVDHFGVVEFTTVGGTGSQADDVRKVIVHSYTYNDSPIDEGGCTITFPPLAVDLVNFNAYGVDDRVVLEWGTLTELNNIGFDIERSANGSDWEKIGFVKGNGSTYEKSDYSWIDKNPIAPQSYYRLKQIDNNGKFEYSSFLSVKTLQTRSKLDLMAFPNPTSDFLSYDFPNLLFEEHEVSVWTLEGKLILRKQVQDQGVKVVNLQSLETGSYLLNVKMANANYSKIIVKQ